jgi:hypothetical protein
MTPETVRGSTGTSCGNADRPDAARASQAIGDTVVKSDYRSGPMEVGWEDGGGCPGSRR